MKKRTKVILIILLIIFSIPQFNKNRSYTKEWQFGNFYYYELQYPDSNEWICFDVIPMPKYVYSYESLFLDIRYLKDFCENYEWWKTDALLIRLPLRNQQDYDLIWFQLSNHDIILNLSGNTIFDYDFIKYP